MKRKMKQALCCLLSAAILLTAVPSVSAVYAGASQVTVTAPENALLTTSTNYSLVSGVTESDVILNSEDADAQVAGFMTTVSPDAQVTFKASYTGYYTNGSTPTSRKAASSTLAWAMETTSAQAAAFESATDETVIFATNGDYYNMQSGQPLGCLVMEGNVAQSALEPYFAVLKDGSYVLREAGTSTEDVAEAISGPLWLVKDGQIVTSDTSGLAPRNSIGLKADGTVVTFLSDGRQDPYSVGQTLVDVAEFLVAQGVTDAIYLDGGGSATYVSQWEGTADLVIRNSPSDGEERSVASALLLVSTAEPDGVFDHAALTPNNTQYTPGSTVQFSAIGVDAAGGSAELPDGAAWALENEEAGTIDENGRFTAAAGYTGGVTVNLMNEDSVVGSTAIVIADLDELYFTGASISLDFGEESGLGLNMKHGHREISCKDGDFQWSVTSTTENVGDEAFGSVANNLFTSGEATDTLTGTVTVSYTTLTGETLTDSIDVEVGKMPVVVLDFEADADGNLPASAHYHWGSSSFTANNGGGYVGSVPSLEVVTSGAYSGSPVKNTISAPYIFTGNFESAVPAADIFHANGYSYYLWPNGSLTEYECGGLKVATAESGGEVRFGSSSLELDYDYASYSQTANANYYIRYCGDDDLTIDGYPSELGVWIYAPEGTKNFIPYIQVEYWNGSTYTSQAYALEPQTKSEGTTGISWSGWMYCSASCTNLWPNISAEHPLRIQPGQGFLWLSYQPGKGNGGRYNGTLYFDNFRAVYGTSVDDLVNPVISSATINGTEIAEDGSTVLDSGSITLLTQYDDPDSENRSGINAEATVIKIDGERKNADKSTTETRATASLNNGRHTVSVTVYDYFGNSATKTYSIAVRNPAKTTPEVSVEGADTVTMGNSYILTLTANGAISSVEGKLLQLNSDFGVPTVTFEGGFTGTGTYTETGYKKASLDITASGSGEGTICTITFQVPTDMDPEIDFFTYDVSTITYMDENRIGYSAAQPAVKLSLSAYYSVAPGLQLEGESCAITVYDADGNPASGVTLSLDGAEIGTTDASGILTTDAMSGKSAGTACTLTASGPGGTSFATTCTVLAKVGGTDGKPTDLHLNATADTSAQEHISWISNSAYTAENAVVRFMTQESYDSAALAGGDTFDFSTAQYTEVTGKSTLTEFPITKNAARVNQVNLTGLTPGTTYCYVAGDGADGNWSDVMTFTTKAADTDTTFLVLGDTQMSGDPTSDTDAIEILNEIAENAGGTSLDFGLQTGDFVDNGGSFNHWDELLGLFQEAFGSMDFVHVLGNHEYYGNFDGTIAESLLNSLGEDYYSVEYGNVYVAVINNSADLSDAAAWLIQDAAKSDCAWKLLSIHQPPYYTNPNGGSESVHQSIPAAADAAGIDAVFSGHDHSYARTSPMTGGAVDANNGVTYFICGDLGEKSRESSYAIVDNPAFHFAKTTQAYDGIYLTASAGADTMTITAYNADGTQIDTTTIIHTKTQPADNTDDSSNGTVTVPVSGNFGQASVSVSVTGGTATVSFTDRQLKEITSGAGSTGALRVDVSSLKIDAVVIPSRVVSAADGSSGNGLAVALPTGTVTLDKTALASVADKGDIKISVETIDHSKLTDTQKSVLGTLAETAVVVDVNVYTGGARTSTFGDGKIGISVPYTLSSGENAGSITVWFIRDDGTIEPKNGAYNAATGCVEFTTDHLSQYLIVNFPFADVAEDAWYYGSVAYAYSNGLFSGTGDTTFSPDTAMTRGMLVTVLWRMEGKPTAADGSFTDVSDDAYCADAVAWASANGIAGGYGNGRFGPDDSITREQMAAILYRYASVKNYDTTQGGMAIREFADYDSISGYALTGLGWAVNAGLMQGSNNNLMPQGDAGRAQVAAILQRFCQNVVK